MFQLHGDERRYLASRDSRSAQWMALEISDNKNNRQPSQWESLTFQLKKRVENKVVWKNCARREISLEFTSTWIFNAFYSPIKFRDRWSIVSHHKVSFQDINCAKLAYLTFIRPYSYRRPLSSSLANTACAMCVNTVNSSRVSRTHKWTFDHHSLIERRDHTYWMLCAVCVYLCK